MSTDKSPQRRARRRRGAAQKLSLSGPRVLTARARSAGAGAALPALPRAGPAGTYQREHFIGVGVLGRAGARRLLQRLLPQVHGGQQGRGRLRLPGRLGGRAAARLSAVPRRALPGAAPALAAAAPTPHAAVALHRGPGRSAPTAPPRL